MTIFSSASNDRPMPRYYRRVIKIRAEDSPNVILGLSQQAAGLIPDNKAVLPGVITWDLYVKRRKTWDIIRQTIGLDAEFYEGVELRMFPQQWLHRSNEYYRDLFFSRKFRRAKAIGIDPGEGGDDTALAVVDDMGLLEMIARKTPDTVDVVNMAIDAMRRWKVEPEYVCFDRGGGGKQHADRMRQMGFKVRTVSFGEPLLLPILYRDTLVKDRIANRDERYSYKNRRAEMFGTLRHLLDPINKGFAISGELLTLRSELIPIPLSYDEEGKMYLLPKNKKDSKDKQPTLIELIGHSPNQADALVVAVYAMTHKPALARAGTFSSNGV